MQQGSHARDKILSLRVNFDLSRNNFLSLRGKASSLCADFRPPRTNCLSSRSEAPSLRIMLLIFCASQSCLLRRSNSHLRRHPIS